MIKKSIIYISITILLIITAYFVGYAAATWKWNCCGWGEGCERNFNPEGCNPGIAFPRP